MAKTLFDIPDDKTCNIFDAIYCAQKSKNYGAKVIVEWAEKNATRQTYGYSPNDWVLFVLGPLDATHNDATIL